MGYLLARLRHWAAHHRLAWWSGAAALAALAGITVQSAAAAEACPELIEMSSDTPAGSLVEGERGVALDRGSDSLPLSIGDRVDLIAVDDYSPEGRLLVAEARVLDIEKNTVTVAVPVEGVAELAAARRWGDVALALVPG
ncbi:MAG: hypothetical protein HN979_00575 [Actinobacteria bacterium]|jgi:hypothetical protein|nr:hypothetical protein [Actinomycetota bacterium]MDP7550025.1 hypothetical protein [Acidimicrobiales bacterium]MBT3686580.1 hypothetical protein [Actinomycetota bacterium]MBT4038332.1 hypothetical protein [Actinomycetota bacterium]MBT4279426.1 hypothetical protein [Actinomycetota bacterium]|tara:strand:+ start:108 stop:527 length:420 start_codon:yes stop_codon:yes gene_type:complete